MTHWSQKDRERFYVSRLLAHLEVEDLENFEPGDRSPDFILAWDGERAGVEVTRLFQPSDWDGLSLQEIERARERVLSTARQLWSPRKDPFVEVLVHFNAAQPVYPEDAFDLAEQLVRHVRNNLPFPNSWTRTDFDGRNRDSLPEEFSSVRIVRLDGYTRSYWSGGAGSYLPPLAASHIQRAVDRKKNHTYADSLGEVWLLIVMESTRTSGAFDVRNRPPRVADTGPFDRVFLLDTLTDGVWEVGLKEVTE